MMYVGDRATLFITVSPQIRRVLPAVLALLVAAALFVNNVFLAPDQATATMALSLSEQIRASDAALRGWLLELNSAVSKPVEVDAPARSDLLRTLNSIALQTGARLGRVTPVPEKHASIQIELEADFASFVHFIGNVEARGSTVRHLQMHTRPSSNGEAPTVAASFLLDGLSGQTDATLSPLAAQHLVASKVLIDPFRWFASQSEASLLTRHVLTGITKMDEEVFATIDGHDYRVGDPVGGDTITAIAEDSVQISSGTEQSWLHFRSR